MNTSTETLPIGCPYLNHRRRNNDVGSKGLYYDSSGYFIVSRCGDGNGIVHFRDKRLHRRPQKIAPPYITLEKAKCDIKSRKVEGMKKRRIPQKGKTYAQRLQEQKEMRQSRDTWEGFNLATMLMVVAINNIFGFGKKRFKTLEDEMNRIWAEEFRKDMEVAAVGLTKRCIQILGDDFEHYVL
jgi:hypothetical protein